MLECGGGLAQDVITTVGQVSLLNQPGWLLIVGCWLVLAQDVITTVGQVGLLFVHCSVVRWVSYISLVYLVFTVSHELYSPIYELEW